MIVRGFVRTVEIFAGNAKATGNPFRIVSVHVVDVENGVRDKVQIQDEVEEYYRGLGGTYVELLVEGEAYGGRLTLNLVEDVTPHADEPVVEEAPAGRRKTVAVS